jgi:nitric oxide reductase activation protein
VKRFDEVLGAGTLSRLGSLNPGGYSRLGAAIRHGTRVLSERAGTPRRLLVVLSDGLAYDHGYEREHGAADVRRALAESQRGGTACLCLSVGADADTHELQSIFGSAAHATVARPDHLAPIVGPLFRVAMRTAEIRHRVR